MLRNTLLSFTLCRKSILSFRICLFCILVLVVGKSHAQQDYFILIQADNSQPFYVKMGTKSFSSTAKGRLILSQLKGGTLSFTIGFPRQLFPEQQWTINIDKDQEFQLKDLGEKGWGLFNPQTLELKAPDKKEGPLDTKSEGIRKDDAFSRLMAGVVSDTAVMYNTYAMEEALKDSPVAVAPVKKDTIAQAAMDSGREASQKAMANNDPGATIDSTGGQTGTAPVTAKTPSTATTSKGTVVKLSERKTAKGLRLAFADRPGGKKADTIVVIIPMDTADRVVTVNTSAKNPLATANDNHAAATQTPSADGKHAKTQASSLDSLRRTEKPLTPADNSRSVADRSSEDSSHNGFQTSREPLFHTKTDTAAIVHTSSDTIHVYLAPHRKPDTNRLAANSDSANNLAVSKGKPDSTHTPTDRGKNYITRNAAGKTRPDSTHNALNKGRPDLTHNTSGKAKTDSAHKLAANKGKPDSAPGTAGKVKPDSTHNVAVNRTKPDTTHNIAGKTRPDTTHTTAVRSKPVIVNSDCRNFAADYDVDKLRVKMLESSKDEERITIAKKVFKTKCFTTRQVKALSEVFTTDAEKFRFFEAAYPFVSDDRFRDLTDLLTDPVYNSKFKTMTGQR